MCIYQQGKGVKIENREGFNIDQIFETLWGTISYGFQNVDLYFFFGDMNVRLYPFATKDRDQILDYMWTKKYTELAE